MASELRVNTLKDASGNNSIATSFVAGGSAKVWMQIKGDGTAQIDGSLNAASLTDNGTGDYTTSFTSSLADTNYCITTGTEYTFSDSLVMATYNETNKAAGSIQLICNKTDEGDSVDVPEVSGKIAGDLA